MPSIVAGRSSPVQDSQLTLFLTCRGSRATAAIWRCKADDLVWRRVEICVHLDPARVNGPVGGTRRRSTHNMSERIRSQRARVTSLLVITRPHDVGICHRGSNPIAMQGLDVLLLDALL